MGKYIDLTGMQFGLLTVLYRAEDYVQPSGQHKRIWHCRCKCGNECDIRASDLKSGNTKSCGCLQQSSRGKSTFEDLTGKEFGRLTVLFRLPDHITPSGQKQRMWRCKLCEEWAYEKNNEIGLFPNKVAPHSDKKAWWRCKKCGNIWQSKIDARTRLQAGCPECGKHLISQSKYKPVNCIETGEVFISLQDAEIKTGINRTCISNCCRGKQKTAGKRHWKFS